MSDTSISQAFPGVIICPDHEIPQSWQNYKDLKNYKNLLQDLRAPYHLISLSVRAKGTFTYQMSHVTYTKSLWYCFHTSENFSWFHFPFSIRNCFMFSGFHAKTHPDSISLPDFLFWWFVIPISFCLLMLHQILISWFICLRIFVHTKALQVVLKSPHARLSHPNSFLLSSSCFLEFGIYHSIHVLYHTKMKCIHRQLYDFVLQVCSIHC